MGAVVPGSDLSLSHFQKAANSLLGLRWNLSKRRSVWRSGNFTVVARHPILKQVASDILSGIDQADMPMRPINLYCGIHMPLDYMTSLSGLKLGIQTEHYFSSEGKRLWKDDAALNNTIENLRHMDAVIDLSVSNAPVYKDLGFDLPVVELGPHIFPSKPPHFSPGTNGRFVFYGSLRSQRRKEKLAELPEDLVAPLKGRTFGDALVQRIKPYRGVLNIHYDEGVYTEYPRLLSALLAGKPYASDPLTKEFEAGKHYLSLSDLGNEPADDSRIFSEMAELLCSQYSFAACLRRMKLDRDP